MAGTPCAYELAASPFGDVGLVWRQKNLSPCIVRIFLPKKNADTAHRINQAFPGVVRRSHSMTEKICYQIEEFMRGNPVDFSLEHLDMRSSSAFQQNVLLENRKIPRGRVSSYGKLAGTILVPGGARATGAALAGNPFSIIIPCHRVIRSSGELGGFGGGLNMKRTFLEMEGIVFDSRGKVNKDYFC
ncbi:MAG: methylated-DNA--[protein]-cysteine S-methyltransferase [Syntrophales bacterium]|nr:methylated-DNA--[protein]-cysteine S-methyltransferase [Syntrophales bacterium]